MGRAEDPVLWSHALRVGAAIVTKEEDFALRICIEPLGPAIVWLRIGNTSRQALLDWLDPLLPRIEQSIASGEKLVEVAPL